MDHETANIYVRQMTPDRIGERAKVGVPLRTGSHHVITLYGRTQDGEYKEVLRQKYSSQYPDLEIDAHTGDIIQQRTTSPAYGGVLERYGVVRGPNFIDWGSDASWPVDFGPIGDTTRRSYRSPVTPEQRKRINPGGPPVSGGATRGSRGTSGGSG